MTKTKTAKANGSNGKALAITAVPRVSPASAVPPSTLIGAMPPHTAFIDLYEPLAWVVLEAMGIEPSAEDPRLCDIHPDQLRGWHAFEIPPLRAALVHHKNNRTIIAAMESGGTVDVKWRMSLRAFAEFHPPQRGELPRPPTPPESRGLEAELQARIRVAFGDVDEQEAAGMAGGYEERFRHETVAEVIDCRCFIGSGPFTPTSYLIAVYPDHQLWSVGRLDRVPLRRADLEQNRWSIGEWNRRERPL